MNSPEIKVNLNYVHIISDFTFKRSGEDLILRSASIEHDHDKNEIELDDYYLKQIQSSYLLDIQIERKERFPVSNSALEFYFISNKRRVYLIGYEIDRNKKCQLDYVLSRDAEVIESKEFIDIIRTNKRNLKDIDLTLDVFKRKLFRELYYLKENIK